MSAGRGPAYLLVLVLLVGASACAESQAAPAPARSAAKSPLTFLVAADTHFGANGIAALNQAQIRAMNALPGKAWPAALGGRVGRPRGVLIAGDLTDHGKLSEWRQFVRYYGRTGRDGQLRYPVFEGSGNHDRPKRGWHPWVLYGVASRHKTLRYAWTWNGVRFINLDLYPNRGALKDLRQELRRAGPRTPVVIYFHFGIKGPYSHWWTAKEKARFGAAIKGYNVVAIFHGHYHRDGHYTWAGFDVYNVGSPRHWVFTFAAVRITRRHLDVAMWDYGRDRWSWHHRKTIRR